jgi:hypothetical protein
MHGSVETGQLLSLLRKEYKIQDDTFIDIVGDIMLGFYPKSEFRKLLTAFLGVSDEVATSIERDLGTLLFKIDGVPVIPPAPRDTRERLDLRPEGFTGTSNVNTVPGNEKPLTREEVLRSITPKRTMASDIESVRREKESGHSPFGDSR